MQIYMTVNRINGKFYIGKNKNCDKHYLGSGKYIKRAIQKHGLWNFYKVILETVDTVEQLNEKEKHWIAYYRRLRAHLMYNIGCGGEWGDTFTHHPDKELIRDKNSKAVKLAMSNIEVRKKISDSAKLRFQNVENLEEHRKRQKIVLANHEVRKKMSDSAKLRFQDEEHLDEHRKRLASTEVRKKMSDSAKAKFENAEYMEEHRKRMKITMSNPEVLKKISDSKKAYDLKSCSIDGIQYTLINEAVNALGIKNTEIRRRCKSVDYPTYFYTS